MPALLKQPLENEDFRTRIAREKRARMRQRLLAAALDVYQPEEKQQTAVIDDIIKKAGVSRGSFYKYYDSLEQLTQQLGEQLTDEMIITYQKLFTNVNSDLAKITGGTVITLARASMDPRWGLFTSSIDFIEHLNNQNPLFCTVVDTLETAKKKQLLQFESIEVASDMLTGATIGATKRLAHGVQQPKKYILEMTMLCMIGLGMKPVQATQGIGEAWQILANNSDQLAWWKNIA